MRIFFFITKSEQGGAQTHVAQLTRWLVEHGHEVAVMSTPRGWLEAETTRLGGRFFPNEDLGNTASPIRLRNASRRFLETVDEYEPDLVACHSTMAGLLGRLSLRGRVPTVFTAHGWGFTQGAPRLRRILLPIFERLAARWARRVICVSKNDLRLAVDKKIAPKDKFTQIYNGVEPSGDPSAMPRDDKDALADSVLNILFVGRLAAPKDPFLLVEALCALPDELRARVRVTVIGDGPDRQRLEELVERLHLTTQVELAGTLPREEVLERLRTADLFVLLSHWEGFPYSILEAMSAGVSVIASRVGGVPEALEHGGGMLVENAVADVAQALQTLLVDAQARRQLGAQAREAVAAHFSVDTMCEKTFAIYEQALLQ